MSDETLRPAETTAIQPAKLMVPSTYTGYEQKWLEYHGTKEQSAFKREVYFLTQVIAKTPKLQSATPNSVVECLMNVAQFGISLNPALKLAYIIPRKNGDVMEAKLELSYMGMAKMLVDAGAVLEMQAECIYTGDAADVNMSAERKVTSHVPYWRLGTDKGSFIAAYTTAYLPDGRVSQYVLPHDEVEAIMKLSDGYKSAEKSWDGKPARKDSVWHLHFSEQAKKTCLRRHFKLIPKSAGASMDKIARVIDLEDQQYQVSTAPKPTEAPKVHPIIWAPAKMKAAKDALTSDPPTASIDDLLEQNPNLHPDQVKELRDAVQQPFHLSTR